MTWLPAYLKLINTHPTLGEGQNGKLYGSGPDPFPPHAQLKGKGSSTRDYAEEGVVVHARNVIAFFVWAYPSGFYD